MIKKLNTVLFVALLLLLGLKMAKDKLADVPSAPTAVVPSAPVRNAEFAPTVYYVTWAPFAISNPVTKRNGYLLDLVRIVFPNARFVRVYGTARDLAAKLREDPSCVLCEHGEHPLLKDSVLAPTPLLRREISVYTVRSNPWVYDGVASLEKLCLSVTEDDLDSKVVRAHYEKFKDDPKRVRFFTGTLRDNVDWRDELMSKRIDGYVNTRLVSVKSSLLGALAEQMLWASISEPIDTVDVRLTVSSRDPNYARQLIDAYERGLKEAEASGELRRLRDYYGITQ